MVIRIYVEGGADNKALDSKCRKAFSEFIEKAGFAGKMPSISPCGSRNEALSDFKTALSNKEPDEYPILLVDSEAPIADTEKPWVFLKKRDNWKKPRGAEDENTHFMVQCMESWFFADKAALKKYYGKDFKDKALSKQKNIEVISKKDVAGGLKKATKDTQKGEYDKGAHSFGILELIDPEKVKKASPYAARFFEVLELKTVLQSKA
ncbi:MAG: DUF4276 family protein [bacterium]